MEDLNVFISNLLGAFIGENPGNQENEVNVPEEDIENPEGALNDFYDNPSDPGYCENSRGVFTEPGFFWADIFAGIAAVFLGVAMFFIMKAMSLPFDLTNELWALFLDVVGFILSTFGPYMIEKLATPALGTPSSQQRLNLDVVCNWGGFMFDMAGFFLSAITMTEPITDVVLATFNGICMIIGLAMFLESTNLFQGV